jgi:hypothetical protein
MKYCSMHFIFQYGYFAHAGIVECIVLLMKQTKGLRFRLVLQCQVVNNRLSASHAD